MSPGVLWNTYRAVKSSIISQMVIHGLIVDSTPKFWKFIIKIFNGCGTQNVLAEAASWSSGRVQDSGLGSRSSPGVQYPAGASAHCAPEQGTSCCVASLDPGANGYLWGQICKPWCQVAYERLYTPQGVEMDIQMDLWTVKGPMTREGTCQSLQSRALSLDVDLKQWLYLYLYLPHNIMVACVCFNSSPPGGECMHNWTGSTLV